MIWVMELSAPCCSADQLAHQGLGGNWEMLGLMFNSLIPSKAFLWKESLNHACAGDVPVSKSSASSKGLLKIKSLKDLFFLKEMKFFSVRTLVLRKCFLCISQLGGAQSQTASASTGPLVLQGWATLSNCTLWILGFCTACSHQTPCNQLFQVLCSPFQDQPLCLLIITGTTQSREGQGQLLAVELCPPDYPTERWFCAVECSQGNLALANCSHKTRAWLEGLSKKKKTTHLPKKINQ